MTTNSFDRFVPLEGILNFRDLGGYPTQNGGRVKTGRLFRSGEYQHATPDDLSHIKDTLAVSAVVDLRSPHEIEQNGYGLFESSEFSLHNVPFTGTAEEGRKARELVSNMGELYLSIMDHQRFAPALARALELVSEAGQRPTLINCTAGKDRTGILAGVILGLLDVSREDIISDYSLSAPSAILLKERIDADPVRAARFNRPDWIFSAVPESMALMLDTIDGQHGSIASFVLAHGVSEATISQLQNALLE